MKYLDLQRFGKYRQIMNQLIIMKCKDSAVKPTHAACPSCS